MKGLGRLIGNENKKVWKQTGLRVILIIIAALTALSPVFNFLTSRALTYEGYGNYMYDPDNIQNQIGYAQESEDVLREKYWRVYESTVNFFTENSIDSEWQIYFFRDNYAQALGWLTVVETVAPGGFTKEDITNSMLMDFIYERMREDDSLSELDPENISRTLADARKELAELENDILSFTLGDYYASRLADAEAERDRCAATLKAYENGTIDSGLSGNSQLDAEYAKYIRENAERALEAAELSVWGWQQLTENLYEYGSWQYNTVNRMLTRMYGSGDFRVAMSEELFNSREYGESLQHSYGTYKQYEKEMRSCGKQWDESKALVLYSLEHGIPLRGTMSSSSKEMLTSEVSSMLGNLVIFMIILAGMTLSNEYTSGTIRLLLIRPQSRSKILTSKLVSLYVWWLAAAGAGALLLGGECMLLFGIKDLFKPDLFIIGGSVAQIPSAITLIIRILLTVLSASPIVLFALLISTLIKKAALPIALSMMGRFATSVVIMLSVVLNMTFPHIHFEYSPFPYLDLTSMVGNAAEAYAESSYFSLNEIISSMTGGYATLSSSIYNIWIGIAWMLFFSALMLVLSFVSFNKQQIKI